MSNSFTALEKIEGLVEKYSKEMDRHVKSYLSVNPDSDEISAKENYFLNKIATLVVGMEMNKKEFDEFKNMFDCKNKNE